MKNFYSIIHLTAKRFFESCITTFADRYNEFNDQKKSPLCKNSSKNKKILEFRHCVNTVQKRGIKEKKECN